MRYVFILLVLFCSYKIYSSKENKRLGWFIGSFLFMSQAGFIEHPNIPSGQMFMLSYLFSLYVHKEFRYIRFPFKTVFIIYLIGLFIIAFNAQQLTLALKIYRPIRLMMETYFMIVIGYTAAYRCRQIPSSILTMLFITMLYGLFTFITHSDPFRLVFQPADYDFFVNSYLFGARTRIASTWGHPISWGLICCVFAFVCVTCAHQKGWEKLKYLWPLLGFNILFCGSRTVIGVFLIMTCSYIFITFSMAKRIKYFLASIMIGLCAVTFVPAISEKIDSTFDVLTGENEIGGSSIEMRESQLEATLAIASKFPITGGGLDYVWDVMGLGTRDFVINYGELLGLESYLYIILIDRGLVGIIIEIMIILSILLGVYRRRHKSPQSAGMVITLLLGFVVFAISTGTLSSWPIPMYFVGYFMNHLYVTQRVNNSQPQI